MFFISTQEFKERLRDLFAVHDAVHAVLTTYNGVGDYQQEFIPTDSSSLTVFVNARNRMDNPIKLMRGMIQDEGIASIPESGPHPFVIMYSGMSAFKESIILAQNLRERFGQRLTLLLLTCNCDADKKRPLLQPLMDDGILDGVIMDKRCGGDFPMTEILEALIKTWQELHPVPRA